MYTVNGDFPPIHAGIAADWMSASWYLARYLNNGHNVIVYKLRTEYGGNKIPRLIYIVMMCACLKNRERGAAWRRQE